MAQQRIMLKIMPKICKDRKSGGLPGGKGSTQSETEVMRSRRGTNAGEMKAR